MQLGPSAMPCNKRGEELLNDLQQKTCQWTNTTLKVESFAGRNFRGDKLSRTSEVKINFRGYKLSRSQGILVKFSHFKAIFSGFLSNISRTPIKVQFRGYKLSRVAKKFAKSRKFLPTKLCTDKVLL